MARPHFIGVDWGTSNFRAYLVGSGGGVLAHAENQRGILAVEERDFSTVLRTAVGPWMAQHGPLPVMMSGMIGSRQGWVEAPYVRCPAGVREICVKLTSLKVEGIGDIHLLPGLDHVAPGEPPDVMRGEETQIIGAIADRPGVGGTFVHPGTHSKWVEVAGSAITGFSTYMTGEVYAALKGHTILGRLMQEQGGSERGFLAGVDAARRAGPAGSLLHHLFSVRTLGLFDLLPADELPEYLSGLLIGAEILAAARPGQSVTILASEDLGRRYGKAADALGLDWSAGPTDSVVRGHLAVARAAGLIGDAS